MENKENKLIPNSVIKLTVSLDDFFKRWLIFLKPYHELADRQIDLAASLLKIRYELSKVILDDKILDETLMNGTSKKKIIEDCGISPAHFQVIMSSLRKHNFILKDGRINPKYIPSLNKENPKAFSLMILFAIK